MTTCFLGMYTKSYKEYIPEVIRYHKAHPIAIIPALAQMGHTVACKRDAPSVKRITVLEGNADPDVGLRARVAQVSQELDSAYEDLAQKDEQLKDFNAAIIKLEHQLGQSKIAADGQRQIVANLNASLVSETTAKLELRKQLYKHQRALKHADADLRNLREDKVASERLIIRLMTELAETRLEAEADKHRLQCEVVSLRRGLARQSAVADGLSSRLAESTKAEEALRTTLDVTQLELSALNTLYTSVQDSSVAAQSQPNATLPSFDTSREMEKIFGAHLLSLSSSCDYRLGEEAGDPEPEIDAMVQELEREFFNGQGALDDAQAEQQNCFVAEWDQVWRDWDATAAMKQHEQVHLGAEKDRADMASQLQDALSQVTQLTTAVQQEQDTASQYCAELLAASEAHLRTMEEWLDLQLRVDDTVKERDEIERKLHNIEAELQVSQDTQKLLQTVNDALSEGLMEKVDQLNAIEPQSHLRTTVDETRMPKRTSSIRNKARLADNKENNASLAQGQMPLRSSSIPFATLRNATSSKTSLRSLLR